jgi:hypothetical protein
MQTVDYKITEGSDFCWDCYGSNAYNLSYWNQDHNGYGLGIIFEIGRASCRERVYRGV